MIIAAKNAVPSFFDAPVEENEDLILSTVLSELDSVPQTNHSDLSISYSITNDSRDDFER